MQPFEDIPRLIDQKAKVMVIETPVTERFSVLRQLFDWAQDRSLPLFFWNPGYSELKCVQFNDSDHQYITSTTIEIPSSDRVLQYLLDQQIQGIFVLEGLANESTGLLENDYISQLSNAVFDLPFSKTEQYLLLVGEVIQLPPKLLPLIPQILNPLPHAEVVIAELESLLSHLTSIPIDQATLQTVTKACLGLPLGEIQTQIQRFLPLSKTLEELSEHMIRHKISKLRGRGLEFIAEPDVPVGGLDLLDRMLDQASALLSTNAKNYALSFPKGIILWGPPGTGKSLSAKHAAKKMGVPLVAADWGGLLAENAGESEANLRFLLQVVEATSPCVLYWDDFDKGFAGWNSDAGGGVQRRLSGKLLTWMQERTAPIYVIATVNRLEMLPAELIRRFDDIIFVDLPHAGARKAIFDIHLQKYSSAFADPATRETVFSEKEWHKLIRAFNLCTAAEIGKAVRKAAEESFYRGTPGQITLADLLYQRQLFTPAMVREEDQLLAIRKRAPYARPASSPDTSKWKTPPAELFEFLTTS
jgi:hypothetical protein